MLNVGYNRFGSCREPHSDVPCKLNCLAYGTLVPFLGLALEAAGENGDLCA